MLIRRLLAIALLFGCLPTNAAEHAAEGTPLVRLAEIGPWPAISAMIGYRGRLWFVNSVKYRNHNSADLYSYNPATGKTRYEAHLFSQDAGEPTIHRGLLYWPFEDARGSVGRGEFMVTNTKSWRWGFLPEVRAFHVHAMASHKGALYAATSAWRAGLQRSTDGGISWKILYDHGNPSSQVSRIVALISAGGRLYAGLYARYRVGISLLRLEGGTLRPVKGWPNGVGALPLTAWRGQLYAINAASGDRALYRIEGDRIVRITAFDGRFVRDVAGTKEALWAITAYRGGGALWRSGNGLLWRKVQDFTGDRPVDIAVHGGRIYVGVIGRNKKGALFGTMSPQISEAIAPAPALPRRFGTRPAGPPAKLLGRLDSLMAEQKNYRGHGPEILKTLRALALYRSPAVGQALSERLGRPYPGAMQRMFGGQSRAPSARVARWYLLWGLAMNGQGRVPARLIGAPWTVKRNGAEKYLAAPPGAAWAAARLGQRDRATIGALIARLGRTGDPDWLEGDIFGALTVLTGQRLGYNRTAWRQWWRAQRKAKERH